MTALMLAVLAASLVGSLHCAGMCGAFVAIASGGATSRRQHLAAQGAYHGGRLLSYAALGACAGAAGGLLDLAAGLSGIEPVAAVLAGATMALCGAVWLLQLCGARVRLPRLALAPTGRIAALHRFAATRTPAARAMIIGLLTTLLPCGWLYAFAVTAAGTGSPLRGAAVMSAFWLGTVPILAGLALAARQSLGMLGRRVPAVAAALLILLGLHTVVRRASLSPSAMAAHAVPAVSANGSSPGPSTAPSCCDGDGN